MKKLNILFALLAVIALASCISDDSTEGNMSLPTLSIAGSDSEVMPVMNFMLGEDCVIKPQINYNGTDTLSYAWYVGTYKNNVKGELKKVSSLRDLEYKFLSGGSYYVHLTVTDGRVGKAVDYQVNINRTFEEGYLLVSSDRTGKGNLAFVKIMTQEEIAAGTPQISVEHIIERMNEGIKVDRLLGVVHGVITWPTVLHRILASTDDHCYFFDPNTFTIASSIRYDDVVKGFKPSDFYADTYYPFAYDKDSRLFIHMNQQYMFGFEYGYFKGMSFEDCYQYSYVAWGSTNYMNMYVDYSTSQVRELNAYGGTFASTGSRLAGEDIMSVFVTGLKGYIHNELVLTRSKSDSRKWYLHEYAGIPYLQPTDLGQLTEIPVTDRTAAPSQGTRFVLSEKNSRYFYPIGNRIYVFLPTAQTPMPDKSQWAISFPEGENVTYMYVNETTDELYVATCTESTQRGNFYIYKCADVKTDNQGSIKPSAAFMNVADRISQIMYKPRL
ncbi:MAG: PKD domain protein [Prevotella sp.]|nr:PKD domain protein [Prevotella sp.]